MKKLLNTLFVTSEDAYLSLDGGNIVVHQQEQKIRVPLHNLESVVCFSYKGATPGLLGECAKRGISFAFYTPRGKYLTSIVPNSPRNVLLRRSQFRIADDEERSLRIAKNLLLGKIYNQRYMLMKFSRDYSMRVDYGKFNAASDSLKMHLKNLKVASDTALLRGIEGNAASIYFAVFDDMILQKNGFKFETRNKRPPLDRVNALLSFAYTLLANDCGNALYGVGLDPYVGFLHTDRPGRMSLGLDLMEELRCVFADRFILTMINNRILHSTDFVQQESGAIILKDDAKKVFLSEWQRRKMTEIKHPFLEEKIEWGLVPHVQALLLARYLRGELDQYPPFFWK